MVDSGAQSSSDYAPATGMEEREARAAFVLGLRGRGIGDRAVLAAIERVPRRLFLAAIYHQLAYRDAAVPIECGQTASAPSQVARMAQILAVQPSHRVLEIGTGSGYQTAVLSHLAGEVHSIERFRGLVNLAVQRLAALKLTNLSLHHGNGLGIGREDDELDTPLEESPGTKRLDPRQKFDRIIVNGAWSEVPSSLISLLRPGGMLLMPVGAPSSLQELVRVTKPVESARAENGLQRDVLDRVRNVSLVDGVAAWL